MEPNRVPLVTPRQIKGKFTINRLIYIVGLIVVILVILSFLGLR